MDRRTSASEPGSWTGSDASVSAFSTWNIAVLAPMPRVADLPAREEGKTIAEAKGETTQ